MRIASGRLFAAGLALGSLLPLELCATVRARDLVWSDEAAVKGAKRSVLWENGTQGGMGALHRVPINQVTAGSGGPGGVRVFILLGALSVELDGAAAGEFGPGSPVVVRPESRYAFTTTAAGECTFLLVRGGPADAGDSMRARDLRWQDLPEPKGAKQASAWGGPAGARLYRLPINTIIAGKAEGSERHGVVHRGAISVEIDGRAAGEFGPGSYVRVPAGAKFAFTATAAGECTFLLQ
jgi:hypothetical protein